MLCSHQFPVLLAVINNTSPFYFVPLWPKSYHGTGPQSIFMRHLVHHRSLSKTLVHTCSPVLLIELDASILLLYLECIAVNVVSYFSITIIVEIYDMQVVHMQYLILVAKFRLQCI